MNNSDKKNRLSHKIIGFSKIPDFEKNGKYYARINSSKERQYNTLFDIEQVVLRETKKGNSVIIRKDKEILTLRIK